MKPVLIFFIIAVIAVTSYFYLDRPATKDSTVNSEVAESVQPIPKADLNTASVEAIDTALKQEAESYIQEITETEQTPVTANQANDFMTGDQKISLGGKQKIESIKAGELLSTEGLDKNTPITIVTEQQQIENVNVAKILQESGGKLDQTVSVLDEGKIVEKSVEQIIAEHDRDEQIPIVKKIEQYEIKTPAEILADSSISEDQTLRIIKEPYRIETTTVDELLMGQEGMDEDNVFYVRNVSGDDDQGIWGIVHNGLIENFASGIALRRGETIKKYRIMIPEDADEMINDTSSSYLGQLIQKKTSESFVYNFKQGKMGRNPDLIYPGQEIIIIRFSAEELIGIYQHFVKNVNS